MGRDYDANHRTSIEPGPIISSPAYCLVFRR
jgi:hypothetical protein